MGVGVLWVWVCYACACIVYTIGIHACTYNACHIIFVSIVLLISLSVAPSQTTGFVITPSTTTFTVRWDDEGFNYRLHVQKKGSTEINTFGPVTPLYNITGLESNTEYTVVVEAYNPLGSANGSVVGYTLPEGEN